MGNLGKYQDFATEAKQAGGVENLIKRIEDAAVVNASPTIFGKGVGVGVLTTLVAAGGVAVTVGRFLEDRRAREALAKQAKEELKVTVGESVNPDGVNLEGGDGESDSGEV